MIQKRSLFTIGGLSINLIMIVLSIIWIIPLWLMIVFATHPENAIYAESTPFLPSSEFFKNLDILQSKYNFLKSIKNSLLLSCFSTFFILIFAAMAGYALAQFTFKGKKLIFAVVMFTLTIPLIATVIPQYIIIAYGMDMTNSLFGVLLPYLSGAFGIFFMRQIFLDFPKEVLEAARLDGAGEFYIFFRIAVPIVIPAIASLAIIIFLTVWNDYLWPLLILQDPESMTAPVVLGRLIGLTRVQWGAMMAGVTVMTLPLVLLFLLCQKYIVSGITSGAVKS